MRRRGRPRGHRRNQNNLLIRESSEENSEVAERRRIRGRGRPPIQGRNRIDIIEREESLEVNGSRRMRIKTIY